MKKTSLVTLVVFIVLLLYAGTTFAVTARGILMPVGFSVCMEGETHFLINPCDELDIVYLKIAYVDPLLIGAYVEVEGDEGGIVCEVIDVEEITLLDDHHLEDNYPPGGNDCADVCECEGNFDGDEDQDGTDAANFKIHFGRSPFFTPCTNGNSCNGDFDCDVDVDGTDAAIFKEDFGRSPFYDPCPSCLMDLWCVYEGDPFIKEYSDSGCLGGFQSSSTMGNCTVEDRVIAEVVEGSIHVTNYVTFNCCSGIEVELLSDDNYILLSTLENPPGACFCHCCFEVTTEIAGLTPGEYTVEVCWGEWGMGYMCETETVEIL